MAISKICTSCKHHNPITVSVCRKCHTALRKDRYKVRVKKKTVGGKTKWTSKTVTGFNKAVILEEELLSQHFADESYIPPSPTSPSPPVFFEHQRPIPTTPTTSSVSFTAYYASAKLTKKSFKNDLEHWNKHVSHRDYKTTQGILEILGDMKDKGYAPATIRHVLTFILPVQILNL